MYRVMIAPLPENESARIKALREFEILDTAPEPGFDDLVHLAAHICETPMAVVSLVDSDRQWFKARTGVNVCGTSRDVAFCSHGIAAADDLFLIPDARADARFADNPLVTGEPHVRFYAGARLATSAGLAVGMLCVMDVVPRELSAAQKDALRALGRQVVAQLELRRELSARKRDEVIIRESAERYSLVVNHLKEIVFQTDTTGRWKFLNPAWTEVTGFGVTEALGKSFLEFVHPQDRDRSQVLFAPLMARRTDYCRLDVRFRTADGGFRWIDAFARLTVDDRGEIAGASGTLSDITQRKLAEDAVRDSESLYHSLVEHLPMYIARKDAEGRFTFANRRLCEALHCSPGEIIGKSDGDFVPAAIAEKFRQAERQILSGGGPLESVEVVPQEDGSAVHLQVTHIALRDAAGKIIGVQTISSDVTEQKLVEEKQVALTRERDALLRRLQLILDRMPIACISVDQDFRITSFNPAAEQIFGYSCEEILGRQPRETIVAGTSWAGVDEVVQRMAFGEMDAQTVSRNRTKDGRVIICEWHNTPLRGEDGALIGYLGMAFDITNRIRAEEALRHSESTLRSFFDSGAMLMGIVELRKDDMLHVSDNAATARFFRRPADQMRGCLSSEVGMPLEMRRLWIDRCQESEQAGRPVRFEFLYPAPEAPVWLSATVSPIRAFGHQPARFAYIVEDVSPRKQFEEKLQQSLEEKEILLKEIHHRVKNNMQVISSLLSLQAGSSGDARVEALFAESQHRINSMALIHEKLYRSHDLARVDFAEYLKDLMEHVAAVQGARARQVTLDVNAVGLELGIDTAIPCGLIVNELVSNAFKHGFPDGGRGTIRIKMHREENRVRLTVRDSGRGLPENIDFNEVTSLGMKLVLMLVRQLRGEIRWENHDGATFDLFVTEARNGNHSPARLSA